MKLFDEIMGLVRRYAPTLLAHLLLVVVLSLFVLDIATLPGGELGWRVWGDVEASLKAAGLSLELWYVIAALLLAYLTAFEWLRGTVLSLPLPLLRIRFITRRDPELLGAACRVLRLEPEPHKVGKALSLVIDRAEERVRQSGERHPYQWLVDRQHALSNYYATVLIFLFAAVAWALGDAPYAREPVGKSRIWLIASILVVLALALRWTIRRHYARLQTMIGYWALHEVERSEGGGVEDPLDFQRSRAIERMAERDIAWRRHPAAIVSAWLGRLLGRRGESLRNRLNYPHYPQDRDWTLLASSGLRFPEEKVVPPAALQARPFESRFAAFLEREGTGLAILTPELSGLAPAARAGGSVYSFAARCHDYPTFAVRLSSRRSLDDPRDPPSLSVESDGGAAIIAKIGPYPIEALIMGDYPTDSPAPWGTLFHGELPPACLIERDAPCRRKKLGNFETARTAVLDIGASYFLALVTAQGLEARLVLQCFRIAGSERLLIVWGFVSVRPIREEDLWAVDPWWKPRAWKNLVRPREGTVRRTVVDYDPDRRRWHVAKSNMPRVDYESRSLRTVTAKVRRRAEKRAAADDYVSIVEVKSYWAVAFPFCDHILVRGRWLLRPQAELIRAQFEALAREGDPPVKLPGPGFGFARARGHLDIRSRKVASAGSEAQRSANAL